MGLTADAKKKYYDEKLKLKRVQHEAFTREHTVRMEVLGLQRKPYVKQSTEL